MTSSADRLRADIDAGRTGDKVRVQDPAAAPLGTDAEAAGTPTGGLDAEPRARVARTHGAVGATGWIIAVVVIAICAIVLGLAYA